MDSVSARFLAERAFHVVFTLPHEINRLILRHPREILDLLMRAAAETLLQFSKNPNGLGGTPYLMTVLHTWTQDLRLHPHVHCLISGGSLRPDNTWHEHQESILFPVGALAKVFRGKFIESLAELLRQGEVLLNDDGQDEATILDYLSNVPKKWNVFARSAHQGKDIVIKYFARYTNRTAISDRRIKEFSGDSVSITIRRDGNEPELPDTDPQPRTINMTTEDFFRRFSQHIPPKGFHRIRYYGLMSPRIRSDIREALKRTVPHSRPKEKTVTVNRPPHVCPVCNSQNTSTSIDRVQKKRRRREDTS